MPTILLKKSDTASAVPSTANLTNLAGGAEVAVNTADRRMYTMNSSSAVVELGTNPSSLTCADVSATLIKAASANITNLSAASATVTTGNLTFSSTAQRITGDMSNATLSNRFSLQNSVTNGSSTVNLLPNGTGTVSQFCSYGASDPTNGSFIGMAQVGATESRLQAAASGTGTFCPLVFNTGGSERVRIDTSGNTGFGGAAAAGTKVNALGTLPSSSTNTTAFGADGTIPSTTTNIYSGFTSGATTEATSFTLSAYQHFRAAQTAFGAGSTVTNQQGFFAASSLTGATNNYGFFSNIASGSNRWNFYAAGTADNYFAGNVGIGTTSTGFNAAGLPLIVGSGSGNTGMTIYSGTASSGSIHFGDTVTTGADGYRGFLNYTHNTNSMQFGTDATERMRITSGGNLLVGTTTDVSGLSGVISDIAGNVRNIPSAGAAKTSAYTLTITDIGEFVTVGTSGSITVPNDTFTAGNAISVYNDTTGNISINCPITTAYLAGTNTDRASLTLATRGIATILFINPSLCVASGNLT